MQQADSAQSDTLPVEAWHLLGIWDWLNFVQSAMAQFNCQLLILHWFMRYDILTLL